MLDHVIGQQPFCPFLSVCPSVSLVIHVLTVQDIDFHKYDRAMFLAS